MALTTPLPLIPYRWVPHPFAPPYVPLTPSLMASVSSLGLLHVVPSLPYEPTPLSQSPLLLLSTLTDPASIMALLMLALDAASGMATTMPETSH